MAKGRNSTVVGFRVSDEERERLRSAAARAGRDESVGDYCKRIVLKEGTRMHKKRGNELPDYSGTTGA